MENLFKNIQSENAESELFAVYLAKSMMDSRIIRF